MIIMHNNNCVEEPTHKVRLFSVTIKRGVSLKKSRYSRTEARCTYAGTESCGHRFYAWRRNDRLLSMRSHLRKSPNGAYVLGENVTPSQGVTLVQDWLKA